MPKREDWPDWDDDKPDHAQPGPKKESTAVFQAIDLEEPPPRPSRKDRSAQRKPDLDEFEPAGQPADRPRARKQAPPADDWVETAPKRPVPNEADELPSRRRRKGELPDDWERQKQQAAAKAQAAQEAEAEQTSAAEAAAQAAANEQLVRELAAQAGPAFAPIDVAALAASISVFSPTRLLLQLPEKKGEELPIKTQMIIQVHHQEQLLLKQGLEPDEAHQQSRDLLKRDWVEVKLREDQIRLTQEVCGYPIKNLVYLDPERQVERSMHAYTPKETDAMALEVAQLIAYYEVLCDLEREQLFQLELDAKVSSALAEKQALQEQAIQDMMPVLTIDPKTAKKNAKMWAKAHEPQD